VSVITDALEGLGKGERTLDEVEALFRQHEWPPRETEPPQTFKALMEAADRDADAQIEATFVEVETAYMNGTITHEQYAHLATVVREVVESQRAGDDQ
jgi:hypothetical protein